MPHLISHGWFDTGGVLLNGYLGMQLYQADNNFFRSFSCILSRTSNGIN